MVEEPPEECPPPTPAPTGDRNEESPATAAGGDSGSTAGDAVTVASTTPTGANLSNFPGSSDFSLTTMVDGEGHQIIAASFEGLLPPPNILRGYDEVVPGSAQEIISWVTDETKHRREIELADSRHRRELEKKESEHRRRLETKGMELGEKALNGGLFRANVGMLLAWPLVIGIVASGTFLIYNGHDTAGTILAESGLAIVVGAFVLQKIEKFMRIGKSKENGKAREEASEDKDA